MNRNSHQITFHNNIKRYNRKCNRELCKSNADANKVCICDKYSSVLHSEPSSYTSRMAGFFLYVSNTTSKNNAHLCFHEIQQFNNTPLEDQRINCSVSGRHVIYYNERRYNVQYPNYYSRYAYTELCELEVYGEF